MSRTERRRTDSDWALMGSPCWSRQCAPGHRVRPTARRRGPAGGPRPRASRAAAGRRATRPRPGSTTRFVSVPNPEPASLTSLATSRSAPLRRSFSGARSSEPVSAAKPTITGRGLELAGPCPDLREDVLGRLEVERHALAAGELRLRGGCAGRKSATAAAITSASHGCVEHGPDDGVAHGGGRLGVDDVRSVRQRDLDPARDDRHLRPARERRVRDRDPHLPRAPVADEPDGVDGLRGSAGAHDDAAAREVRVPRRRGERRARGRVRLADGPAGDGVDDRVHDERQVREPADALLARRERADLRRRPCGSRSRAGGARRCRGSRGASTCRRPSPGRTTTGADVARQAAVTASFAMPFAIAPSQRAVAGATTITSAASATTMCPIRWSGRSPRTSVSTACRESAPNVSGPTNVAAAGVSITTTSAPSARSRRSSSTALYAAIEPHTPRPISRPSSRPLTGPPATARRRRPRRGGSRGP